MHPQGKEPALITCPKQAVCSQGNSTCKTFPAFLSLFTAPPPTLQLDQAGRGGTKAQSWGKQGQWPHTSLSLYCRLTHEADLSSETFTLNEVLLLH